ncbi:LamG-like jellyroll fold domain-containing protein [Hymenobacter negativus]|uniref:Fibronectin type III domain-containing protein n=1 Tax=Hymenobacter negativus TaxID=2795026 RepID=A0ABS3Q9D7_9BACT|nr:LamG-like jellyroll fold domain-containing protein [Hymenobacter negativus]MBO2007762.1 fibronectin type III domain-containing protein [Hymenobacter negativus]
MLVQLLSLSFPRLRHWLAIGLLVVAAVSAATGQPMTFSTVGTGANNGNGNYTVTTATSNVYGGFWSDATISLAYNFDLTFVTSQPGGDGMLFVLHNSSATATTASLGSGMGYYGGSGTDFAQSLGLELDIANGSGGTTGGRYDQDGSHLALVKNKNYFPYRYVPITTPSTLLTGSRLLRLTWSAATTTLTGYLDGVQRFSYSDNLTSTVFGGNPNVRFGFTGACGGAVGLQTVTVGQLSYGPAPALTTLAPQGGPVGTSVVLTGSNLGTATAVSFNGTAAAFTVNSATQITATVPAGATSGLATVTSPGGSSTGRAFTVGTAPGNALAFDGTDDYVAFGPTPAAHNLGPNNFTLEAWVQYNGGAGAQSIIRKTGDYNLYINGNTLHAEVWPNGTGNTAWRRADGTAVLPANRWVHVAAVWNKAALTYQLYVNGVADGTGTSTTGTVSGSENLTLGKSTIYGNLLTGRLDEVRIYNTSLTAADVAADMRSLAPALPANLMAYFNFDQGSDAGSNADQTTLLDLSSNAYPGTLSNFGLTGAPSNYVASYAAAVPTATAPTNRSATGFTATWTAPALGTVTGYLLDVATNASFSAAIAGSPFTIAAPATSFDLTGLNSSSPYFYRVRALNAGLANPDQGAFSNRITLGSPLPVELSAFTASFDGSEAVRLAWTTASEKNSARFEVERSIDGSEFGLLSIVPAAGSSAAQQAYALRDAHLPHTAAMLYYRLRLFDADGTANYSPVRGVARPGANAATLFPTPATGLATLSGAAPGAAVRAFDVRGREVTATTADASGTAILQLPAGLPSGLYVVRAGSTALRLTVE